MKIDDLIFSKFVGNALTHKQMEDVEQQLIADGEFSAAIGASIIDYEVRQDEANTILGFDNIENKDNIVVRNPDSIDSIESNNTSLTTNNSIIMNINFTKDEILKIQELSTEFSNTEDKNLTLNENLVSFYLNQRPGTTKEEAEKIVEHLATGIRTFHEQLSEALKNNGIDYVNKLRELGGECTNEQKYEAYVNFLATLIVLDVQNYDTEKTSQIEDFNSIKAHFKVTGEVTDEMLDDIIQKIAAALNDNTFCLTTTETLETLFDKIQESSTLEECLSGSEEDLRVKLINAMMTYIAYQKGEIASLAGQEITPEAIAVGSAVGVEQARTMERFRLGQITWEDALDLLKLIGGVALFCLLTLVFSFAAAALTLAVFATLTSIMGGSILAMILAGAASLCLAFKLADITAETTIAIMEWTSTGFDETVKFWQETAWPFIKQTATELVDWIKGKVDDQTIEVQTEGGEQPIVVATQG